MACIAPPKNSLEQRRSPEEGNLESPCHVSKRDAPNRVMTPRTPPSRRSNSGTRLSPGDIYQTGGRAKNVSAHTSATPPRRETTPAGAAIARTARRRAILSSVMTHTSHSTRRSGASIQVLHTAAAAAIPIAAEVSWISRDPHKREHTFFPQPPPFFHLPCGRELAAMPLSTPDSATAETHKPRLRPAGPRSGPRRQQTVRLHCSSTTSVASRNQHRWHHCRATCNISMAREGPRRHLRRHSLELRRRPRSRSARRPPRQATQPAPPLHLAAPPLFSSTGAARLSSRTTRGRPGGARQDLPAAL